MAETYDTNIWGSCDWVQVYSHRRMADGSYNLNVKWSWIPARGLKRWFRDPQREGVLCFATTARYDMQNKGSKQLSNFCGDFDAKSDEDFEAIANSIDYLRSFFLRLGVPEEYFRVWFSGGRSFHFEVPYQAFGIRPQTDLHRKWKFVATGLNEDLPANCFKLDLAMYSNPRMFRLPNSFYPKYGCYKVELTHDEVCMPITEIRKMAESPHESLCREEAFVEYEPIGRAVVWWEERMGAWEELNASREEVVPVDANALKLLGSPPVCITDLRANAEDRLLETGTPNKAQMLDASYSLASGLGQAQAVQEIKEWVGRVRPGYENTESVVSAIYEPQNHYKFACSYAWHLGLACSMDACPLYTKKDTRKHEARVRMVAKPAVPESPVPVPVPLSEARAKMQRHLKEAVVAWYTDPTPSIWAYTLPPGGGKTITTLRTFFKRIVDHFLYFAPRHAMLEEQEKEFPGVFRVQGRAWVEKGKDEEDQLCTMRDECDRYGSNGWNVVKNVCMAKCSKQFSPSLCGYRAQFKPRDSALAHEYLFFDRHIEWLTRGDGEGEDAGLGSWVTVIDEPNIDMFLDMKEITVKMLEEEGALSKYDSITRFTSALAGVLTASGAEKDVFLKGPAVLQRVQEVLGEDTEELLDSVLEAERLRANLSVRVPFLRSLGISASGKSVGFELEKADVWLPFEEVEIDETENNLVMTEWAAAKYSLLGQGGGQEEVRKNFLTSLVEGLKEDLKKEPPYNSSLTIASGRGGPVIRVGRKNVMANTHGPVVMLGAYAEPRLLSVLAQREVKQWAVPLEMATENIVQIIDGQYGITTLWDKEKGEPKRSAHRLISAVKTLSQGKEEESLVITWKLLAEWLMKEQEAGRFDPRVEIAWYSAVEGLNAFQKKKQVFLLGTSSVSPQELLTQAHAIWASSPTPLNEATERVWTPYNYTGADGSGMEALVLRYVDERLNWLLEEYREHEVAQAAHRIRPLLHRDRTIYLFTSLPIDALPPKRLCRLNDLILPSDPSSPISFLAENMEWMLDEFSGFSNALFVKKHEFRNLTLFLTTERQNPRQQCLPGDSRDLGVVMYNKSIYINNKGEIPRKLPKEWFKLSVVSRQRWVKKVVDILGLSHTTISLGQRERIKVWHRPYGLDRRNAILAHKWGQGNFEFSESDIPPRLIREMEEDKREKWEAWEREDKVLTV